MTTIQSIEILVAINLLLVGVSHYVQPGMWVKFFQLLSSKKEAGNVFNALLSSAFGSLIISFHWVWEGPMMVVTIYGLLQLMKGTVYLIWPTVGINSIAKVNMENAAKFKTVGIGMTLMGILLLYFIFGSHFTY